MRLLLVGSDFIWSIERHYFKYFLALNPDTFLFAGQNKLFDYLNHSLFNKIKHKLGLSHIYQNINDELIQTINLLNPEVIFIFKGMQVLPSTLQFAKQKGILVANYNPDNPFIFSGAGSGNKNVTKSLPYYDIFFSYNLEIKSRLENEFHQPVHFLPFGYDLSLININDLQQVEEINRVCFLGNPDKQRAIFITQLNKMGISLDVYGNDWNKYISNKKNQIFPPVYGREFYITLRKYRVQLNIMRIHNLTSHNMRSFEIPAVGGIQLAPDTPEHQLLFISGQEIFLYKNVLDCKHKIIELLNLSEVAAEKIRDASMNKSQTSGSSYKERASYTYNILNAFYDSFHK